MGVEGRKTKLSLEDYLAFYENPQNTDLTCKRLSQIISMHGFMKVPGRKKDLIGASNSIEPLLPPQRSTLLESTLSAILSIDQVKEDLKELEWQECPIQSIETLKLANELLDASNDLHIVGASSTSDPSSSLPKRKSA